MPLVYRICEASKLVSSKTLLLKHYYRRQGIARKASEFFGQRNGPKRHMRMIGFAVTGFRCEPSPSPQPQENKLSTRTSIIFGAEVQVFKVVFRSRTRVWCIPRFRPENKSALFQDFSPFCNFEGLRAMSGPAPNPGVPVPPAKTLSDVFFWQEPLLRRHVCRVNFARKILFRATNFLTKNAPKFSTKILSLCSVDKKKIPENSLQISHSIFQISLRKIKKKKSPTSFCRSAARKKPLCQNSLVWFCVSDRDGFCKELGFPKDPVILKKLRS